MRSEDASYDEFPAIDEPKAMAEPQEPAAGNSAELLCGTISTPPNSLRMNDWSK